LKLINGILISDSDSEGPMETVIERAEMVSGLHELLQYMNKGAKARAIIPFRLAYGFTGDQERIPKGATLVYDVEILDIK
jgi:FKBP-type peptidyl-prolyl cis-trans isomerase